MISFLRTRRKDRPRGKRYSGGSFTVPEMIPQMTQRTKAQLGGHRHSVRLREAKKEIEIRGQDESMPTMSELVLEIKIIH